MAGSQPISQIRCFRGYANIRRDSWRQAQRSKCVNPRRADLMKECLGCRQLLKCTRSGLYDFGTSGMHPTQARGFGFISAMGVALAGLWVLPSDHTKPSGLDGMQGRRSDRCLEATSFFRFAALEARSPELTALLRNKSRHVSAVFCGCMNLLAEHPRGASRLAPTRQVRHRNIGIPELATMDA